MNERTVAGIVKASGVSAGELILVHFWGEDSQKDIANRFVAAGAAQGAAPAALGPGELCLFSGEGAVILRRDGSITLRGTVKVEGELLINGMPWVQAQGEGG